MSERCERSGSVSVRRGLWAAWMIGMIGAVAACSGGENNDTSPQQDMRPAVMDLGAEDLGTDLTPAVDQGADLSSSDLGEDMLGVDMAEDMAPARCPDQPACARGYDFDAACQCVAPINRACTSDADCRINERCVEVPRPTAPMTIDSICTLEKAVLDVVACPGAEGCASNQGVLRAAAVSQIITPEGFETATPAGLDGAYMTFDPPVRDRTYWNDCGYDGLCPGDAGYVAPDEGEGDGELQGMWIAGFTNGRPAQYCEEALIGCDRPECCVSKFAHDDIRVQIAVFEQGELRVAFAVVDAVGYFHTYIDAIREEVARESGIDLLIMSSTHSHESPDTVGQWGPGANAPLRHGRDPRHMARIKNGTIEGIARAVSELEEARLEVAVLDVGIQGLAMGDSRPPYIIDDNVPVVRVTKAQGGAPIATMLSVGNHAEVLWSQNPYISSDYFHFTRKYVAEGLAAVARNGEELKPALEGMGGVTLMFAGTVGGLVNPGHSVAQDYAGDEFSEHGYAKADALGQRLAMHVLEARERGDFVSLDGAALSFGTKRFLTPITNKIFILGGFVARLFERDIYDVKRIGVSGFVPTAPMVMSQVAVVRLGPLSFFTAPGEAFPELLVGGYPGKPSAQNPVIGDILEERTPAQCDIMGLPVDDGEMALYPCIVKPDQENPPDWSSAPDPPYVYDMIPGEYPFFIGLGMDFLGYMVPAYDYEPDDAPGAHYEETNGASGQLAADWIAQLGLVIEAVK